jgi:hypothetical protein
LLSQAALGLHAAHQAGIVHGRLTAAQFSLTHEGMLKITGLGEPPWLHPNMADDRFTVENDLRQLGVVVGEWIQNLPKRRSRKQLPDSLLALLRGLGVDRDEDLPVMLYSSTSALLDDLDRASRDAPADVASWEKLLEETVANSTDGPLLRQSA